MPSHFFRIMPSMHVVAFMLLVDHHTNYMNNEAKMVVMYLKGCILSICFVTWLHFSSKFTPIQNITISIKSQFQSKFQV